MQTQASTTYRSYSDKQFVEQHLASLYTFIWMHQHCMQLLLVKKATQEIAALYEIDFEEDALQLPLSSLRNLLQGLPVDVLKTEHVTVVLAQPKYTLVPEPLFVAEKASDLFNIVHPVEKFYSIQHHRTPQGVLLFATPDIFVSTLRVALPGADVLHAMQCIFPAVSKSAKNPHQLHVWIHDNNMEVMHFNQHQLRYCNRFPFEADTDIVYFLLSVAELLKLNNEQLSVCMYGNVSAMSSMLPLMRKYISNVSLMQRPDVFHYPAAFREMQDHHYYPVLTALLCE